MKFLFLPKVVFILTLLCTLISTIHLLSFVCQHLSHPGWAGLLLNKMSSLRSRAGILKVLAGHIVEMFVTNWLHDYWPCNLTSRNNFW